MFVNAVSPDKSIVKPAAPVTLRAVKVVSMLLPVLPKKELDFAIFKVPGVVPANDTFSVLNAVS